MLHRSPLLLSCTVAPPCQADLGFHLSKDDLMKADQSPVETGKWKTIGAKVQPHFVCSEHTSSRAEESSGQQGVESLQMWWRWPGPRVSCPWYAPMCVMRPWQLAQCFHVNLPSSIPSFLPSSLRPFLYSQENQVPWLFVRKFMISKCQQMIQRFKLAWANSTKSKLNTWVSKVHLVVPTCSSHLLSRYDWWRSKHVGLWGQDTCHRSTQILMNIPPTPLAYTCVLTHDTVQAHTSQAFGKSRKKLNASFQLEVLRAIY